MANQRPRSDSCGVSRAPSLLPHAHTSEFSRAYWMLTLGGLAFVNFTSSPSRASCAIRSNQVLLRVVRWSRLEEMTIMKRFKVRAAAWITRPLARSFFSSLLSSLHLSQTNLNVKSCSETTLTTTRTHPLTMLLETQLTLDTVESHFNPLSTSL